MAKYRKRPEIVDAIKFEYTVDGINQLRELCGKYLGDIKKDRHMGAVAEAEISTIESSSTLVVSRAGDKLVRFKALEGDFVVSSGPGKFWTMPAHAFDKNFEPINMEAPE